MSMGRAGDDSALCAKGGVRVYQSHILDQKARGYSRLYAYAIFLVLFKLKASILGS